MPSLFHSLFPCFAGGENEQQSRRNDGERPAKRRERNTSAYSAPIPVSQAPARHEAPSYRPDTDKKLPPQPGAASTAIELPGSALDLHEMPSAYVPRSKPLARPFNATTSADLPPRPSQQSEHAPSSPYSPRPSSAAASTYQPPGSVRAPSERDPDEISPVQASSQRAPRGGDPNMYVNVADALTDRRLLFERLRKANDTEGRAESVVSTSPGSYTVVPVEMEAPMQQKQQRQQQAPSEPARSQHVRNMSGPRELE